MFRHRVKASLGDQDMMFELLSHLHAKLDQEAITRLPYYIVH